MGQLLGGKKPVKLKSQGRAIDIEIIQKTITYLLFTSLQGMWNIQVLLIRPCINHCLKGVEFCFCDLVETMLI